MICQLKLIYQVLTLSIPHSIPEHVESAVLSQTLQRFESESEEQMSDDAPSTLKRTSTERRSIIQRYRKLMRRESRDFPNNTDENGENSPMRHDDSLGRLLMCNLVHGAIVTSQIMEIITRSKLGGNKGVNTLTESVYWTNY